MGGNRTIQKRLPAIFFGHGNPMNALAQNAYTDGWRAIGQSFPRPHAILAISAHWYIPATAVTVAEYPRTIYDFGGFPPTLSQITYPAPGSLALAKRVQELLASTVVARDEHWGLDHGIWSVLCHVFPSADIPVVQLSLDRTQPPNFHYELAQQLAPLREEGVFIMASGNLIHNLSNYTWGQPDVAPFDWAQRFENQVRARILHEEVTDLLAYEQMGHDALLSVPTPEHFLPLLYVLGVRYAGEAVKFPVEGFEGCSISMLTVQFG